MRFLAILSMLTCLIWLIFHILIDKVDFQVLTVIKLLEWLISYA